MVGSSRRCMLRSRGRATLRGLVNNLRSKRAGGGISGSSTRRRLSFLRAKNRVPRPTPSKNRPPGAFSAISISTTISGQVSRRGNDHRARLCWLISAELANETFDRLIAAAKPTLEHQVLPDRYGIALAAQTQFDRLTERFAQTGGQSMLRIFRF